VTEEPRPPGILSEILSRIVWTGLLSGGLGLALYGGFAIASGSPAAPFILAIVLSLPLAALCLWQVAEGWRSGALILWRGGPVRRDEQPASYRFGMGLYGLCALALVGLIAWNGWRFVQVGTP
jgi:hypothetical protein